MKKITAAFIFILVSAACSAQLFVDKGMVEYEVKSNLQKTIGNDTWGEMMKANLPVFKVNYFNLIFDGDKSMYSFSRWEESTKLPEYMRRDDEQNIWYSDFSTGKTSIKKSVFGTTLLVNDSIPKLEWRLTNESRIIAGFNCKKAVTKIFDSVYVFAFYTEEIMVPAGPVQINGLPGLIMGVTIPRLFTSYIATKVSVNGVDLTKLKAPEGKKTYTNAAVKALVYENTKDWFNSSNATAEQKAQKDRFLWSVLL